ncbi:MAG: sugar ABC transporter ATP-binding protein [Bacillota bacterium]
MEIERIRMEHIHKSFPGVYALKDVSFSVLPGEVHALVGENGAGKSTLIKILMGAYSKDSGEIYLDGQKVEVTNPIVAQELGLSAVYQDVMLAPHLSIMENIFLGRQPKRAGIINFQTMYLESKKILERLELSLDPKTLVRDLTSVQAEMVAIAKAISKAAKVLILDEPTALLAAEETAELFQLVKKLKADGISIIYISHRMEEIFEICDRATVMRDGQKVATLETKNINEDDLIKHMVGRKLDEIFYKANVATGREVLKVKGLSRPGILEDISFTVHAGEILGIFGLVGSGRTEIVRAIFGADKVERGDIYIEGKRVKIANPTDAIRNGIGLLPENRKLQGLTLNLSVGTNINLASYQDITVCGVIKKALEAKRSEQYVSELSIKTPSLNQLVGFLSGGNQQKVVIAKWLCKNSKVLMFDEPTVGVDVGAKAEIFKLLGQLVSQGKALILISSYLPEILGVSDRIVVLSEGRISGIVNRDEADQEKILKLATASGKVAS